MKMIWRSILGLAMILIISMTSPVWACDAMGSNRHVGVVTKIDPKTGTFTTIDAQTRKPMTFLAQKDILDSLLGVQFGCKLINLKKG